MMDADRLRAVVDAIPSGRWASYGDVVTACGGHASESRALNARLTDMRAEGVHRVLRGDGTVGATALGDPDGVRIKLEADGLGFEGDVADPEARLRTEELLELAGPLAAGAA